MLVAEVVIGSFNRSVRCSDCDRVIRLPGGGVRCIKLALQNGGRHTAWLLSFTRRTKMTKFAKIA